MAPSANLDERRGGSGKFAGLRPEPANDAGWNEMEDSRRRQEIQKAPASIDREMSREG